MSKISWHKGIIFANSTYLCIHIQLLKIQENRTEQSQSKNIVLFLFGVTLFLIICYLQIIILFMLWSTPFSIYWKIVHVRAVQVLVLIPDSITKAQPVCLWGNSCHEWLQSILDFMGYLRSCLSAILWINICKDYKGSTKDVEMFSPIPFFEGDTLGVITYSSIKDHFIDYQGNDVM